MKQRQDIIDDLNQALDNLGLSPDLLEGIIERSIKEVDEDISQAIKQTVTLNDDSFQEMLNALVSPDVNDHEKALEKQELLLIKKKK